MKMKSKEESLNTSGECDGSGDLLTGKTKKKKLKQRILRLLPCCRPDSTPSVRQNSFEEEFELATIFYRPESLEKLMEMTSFNKTELQVLYRSFKNDCPTGVVNEENFNLIYSHFFPQGDSSAYAHFLFDAFDRHKNGLVTFEDFVVGLSIILRGSITDRLCWAFSLYDLNKDGCITREEMNDIMKSIYDLMGNHTHPCIKESTHTDHVERFFQKMDTNNDGVVTLEEFMETCQKDEAIMESMHMLDNVL